MVYPSWISPIDINVTKPRLEEQNSLVPICKGLLASIIVIRYEEHDQDGGSMINVYHIHLYLKRAHWTQYSATSEHATTWNFGFLQCRWESKGTGTTELCWSTIPLQQLEASQRHRSRTLLWEEDFEELVFSEYAWSVQCRLMLKICLNLLKLIQRQGVHFFYASDFWKTDLS